MDEGSVVAECPACGAENLASARACARCGLDANLFEPVRSALGTPEEPGEDPRWASEIRAAVGPSFSSEAGGSGPGEIANPSRFPSAPSPAPSPPAPPAAPGELPELPALEPGPKGPAVRKQLDELLAVARRIGVDLGRFEARVQEANRAGDTEGLDAVRRELFVQMAAGFAENLESALARRNELASLGVPELPDASLDAARVALGRGDLGRVHRELHRATAVLTEREDAWATIQVLAAEAELLVETVRELGGDPAPVLGPLGLAARAARSGDRATAEPLYARSILGLWHLTGPLLIPRVAELERAIAAAADSGRNVAAPRAALHRLAREVSGRNFGAGVAEYRRARDAVALLDARAGPPLAASQ